jgi:hypothetical protein
MSERFYFAQGVPKDMVQSFLYAALCAKQGDPVCEVRVQNLAGEMTPEEQARAQALITSWKPTTN